MATNFKPWSDGKEYGTYYLFDKAGEGIAMHSHVDPVAWHFTVCLSGQVAIYGDGIDTVLSPGEHANFKSYRMHEIAALTDGAEIVNVFVNGQPPQYAMDDPTLVGSVASELRGKMEFV